MTIKGIDTVVFSAPDMDEAHRFFTDWGLKRVRSGKSGMAYQTAVGSEIVVRPPDAKGLPAPAMPGDHFREVIYGVSSEKHLDDIAKELSKDQDITVDKDGTVHAYDPSGFGIGFRLWKCKDKVDARRAPINGMGALERIDERSIFYDRARPIRMGHIVFLRRAQRSPQPVLHPGGQRQGRQDRSCRLRGARHPRGVRRRPTFLAPGLGDRGGAGTASDLVGLFLVFQESVRRVIRVFHRFRSGHGEVETHDLQGQQVLRMASGGRHRRAQPRPLHGRRRTAPVAEAGGANNR
jgi:hypothetical protein